MTYIKLAATPTIAFQLPRCSACGVELVTAGPVRLCPVCGTTWHIEAEDGSEGTLDPNIEGPALSDDDAFAAGLEYVGKQRDAAVEWLRRNVQ